MQKSLAELMSLPPSQVSEMISCLREPLLVTDNEEPQFIAQSLLSFEAMVRKLRALEAENRILSRQQKPRSGKLIPFRR